MSIGRPSKPSKALNCQIKEEIWIALDEYCRTTGVNKTFVAEKSISEYLDKQKKQKKILEQHDTV